VRLLRTRKRLPGRFRADQEIASRAGPGVIRIAHRGRHATGTDPAS
jgi:hypothetical protein